MPTASTTSTNILITEFKTPSEIDAYFQKLESTGFSDWYNKNHAGKDAFSTNTQIKNPGDFSKVWTNLKTIYNKDSVNVVEFLTLTVAILSETNSAFRPVSEKIGSKGSPGIAYAFNLIDEIKPSYNNENSVGNKSAFTLFNDPDYVLAHGHKPFGTDLKNTTDKKWDSEEFPLGFSGNVDKETSVDSSVNSFISEADFYKFRGRGLLPTIGRDAYKKVIKFINTYSGQNTKLISYKSKWTNYGQNYDQIASISTNSDWDDLFNNTDSILASAAINIDQSSKKNFLIINASQDEANLDKSIRVATREISDNKFSVFGDGDLDTIVAASQKYSSSLLAKVKQLINALNSTVPPPATTQPQVEQPPVVNDTSAATASAPIVEQPRDNDNQDAASNNQNQNQDTPSVEGLTNFFRPTIDIEFIDFKLASNNKLRTDEITDTIGFLPFVWYNGLQLEHSYIMSFQLASTGLLPTIKMTFADQYGQFSFEDNGFPLDDAKIKIYIASRARSLRPILMDFKITKFKKITDDLYSIEGICDVNYMFLKKFESYSQKTSFEALQEFARKSLLGFNSNIDNTNDSMTWINPGTRGMEFIANQIIEKAYKSDDAFLWCYVDFYYNLNYVDIETALNTDIRGIGNVQNMGLQALSKLGVDNTEDVTRMILSNDKSYSSMNLYFSEYKIINKSTDISLKNGYLNRVKYYDINNIQYLTYDIDAITTQGDKTIIMKGDPQDDSFFAENITETYIGKLDQTNMHRNYNYAKIQNKLNIDEIQKVSVEIKLPIPNFNLYRFQKVMLIFNQDTPSLGSTDINNRLSGEWLVLNLRLVQNGNDFDQWVSLIKREMDLSKQELESEPPAHASQNGENSGTSTDEQSQDDGQDQATNEVPPADQPIAHPNQPPFDLSKTFKNASELDAYFAALGYSGFSDWFNKTQAFSGAFAKSSSSPERSIQSDANWKKVWSTINIIFGVPTCNVAEFLCINTIMINETGGKFSSKSESVNSSTAASDPGIAYAFNATNKKSYNTLDTNKTAFNLFKDKDYKDAHGQKPYGNQLKDTTDQRWSGSQFPVGFNGANDIKKEVSTNSADNSFISEADFYKFRGRGYIQLTGRANYKGMVQFVVTYTGANSKILSYKTKWSSYGNDYDKVLTVSTNADWDDLFTNTDSIIASESIFLHAKSKYQIIDPKQSEPSLKKAVRNVAAKVAGANAKDYIDLFESRVYQQIDWLQKNFKDGTTPASGTTTNTNTSASSTSTVTSNTTASANTTTTAPAATTPAATSNSSGDKTQVDFPLVLNDGTTLTLVKTGPKKRIKIKPTGGPEVLGQETTSATDVVLVKEAILGQNLSGQIPDNYKKLLG